MSANDPSENVTGYLHAEYAESLAEFGDPLALTGSKGWLLKRQIPGSANHDAMGCYPVFACQDWSRLKTDLDELVANLVSASLVTDPFGNYDPAYLRECFPDVTIPFKEHFVVDLSCRPETFVHAHHRRNAGKALQRVQVIECPRPIDYLEEWTTLYEELKERHNIKGIPAFSRKSFAGQLNVPGLVAFKAVADDVNVGMLLWYRQGNRAYYHLGAYSSRGYELGASFALFSYSLDYFDRLGLEWLSLGAGAGAEPGAESGLTRFKQGWSTGVRTAYFCGRIFDEQKYQEIMRSRGAAATEYFPAYRAGEFG